MFNKNTENYFDLFGISSSFAIDTVALEEKYFALQREYHPDLLARKSDEERILAASKSATINDGYKVLKNDLKRAEYILFLHDIIVNADGKGVPPCKITLMEAMELREELLEAETLTDVEKIEKTVTDNYKDCISRIGVAFEGDKFDEAAQLATRMRYIDKFIDEIRIKKLSLR